MAKPVVKIPNPSDCSKDKQPYLYFTGTIPSYEIFTSLTKRRKYKATIAGFPNISAVHEDLDKATAQAQRNFIHHQKNQ